MRRSMFWATLKVIWFHHVHHTFGPELVCEMRPFSSVLFLYTSKPTFHTVVTQTISLPVTTHFLLILPTSE
uniref:Secreted protein n=1 Tax=Anguilla anguilla TaxID=7936 RepID=A0A0E9R177_ANGAN